MRSAPWLAVCLLVPATALGNPSGGKVHSGAATIRHGAGRVDIHQGSQSAVIGWDSFDIAPGEVTQFHQPGKDAVAINRIFSGDASQILGSLQANGHVYLINPHGILFGREAQVNVHALIATTTVDGRELQGGVDVSAQAAPDAQIVNKAEIQSGAGGFVYLVAPFVRNGSDGVIVSPEGEVKIEAGATVYLTDRTDGGGFAVEYTAVAGGEAVNLGQIFADGGFARLRGDIVTQAGVVQANAIRERAGVIELVADSTLTLGAESVTRAAGGADALSHAGTVDAWSDGDARMEAGALVDVSAKADGANGGFAEVSAAERVDVAGTFAAAAGKGGIRGEIVIDPEEIRISGDLLFRGAGSVTLEADREIAIAEGASVDLARVSTGRGTGRQKLEMRSGGDIVFERDALIQDTGTGKTWDVDLLAESGDLVFEGGANSGLRLARGNVRGVAGEDVVLFDGTAISSIEGDVDVEADRDVIFRAERGTGMDTVIESGSGDVRVVAGRSVLLQETFNTGGNAAIRTRGVIGEDSEGRITKTAGGDVLVWAKTGDVDAGVANRWIEPGPNFLPGGPERDFANAPDGPDFDPMPVVNPHNQGVGNEGNLEKDGVLGIGTEAGGSVVVLAGGDVRTSATPLARTGGTASGFGATYDGAHIGAYGVPVYYDQDPAFQYRGAVALPNAPESRLIVVAGGEVTGDYAIRNGEATLLGGYSLPSGVDSVAELAAFGLDRPLSVERGRLRNALDISALAADPKQGWVGTLGDPITVDLIDASVDMLGRNGVAVRAIEDPALAYPQAAGRFGTGRTPTFEEDSTAIVEAETGDIILVGNEAVTLNENGIRTLNPLIWLLPPNVKLITHDPEDERAGDLVQVEDFTLYPSARGGLELDIAGKVRTASGVASREATITIDANTIGGAIDRVVTIPSGSRLRDPETGLIYTITSDIVINPRREAQPGDVTIEFVAERGFEDQQIDIPVGTAVVDYNGNVFRVVMENQRIEAPANRLSSGEVRFRADGLVIDPVTIQAGTLLQTPSGARFQVVNEARIEPGQNGVDVQVRAMTPGVDAEAGELSLVDAVPGISRVVQRFGTQRLASAEIKFVADVPGSIDTSDFSRIKNLVTALSGARFAYGTAPKVRSGSDPGTTGQPAGFGSATATVIGPVGEIRGRTALELVDLPAGVTGRQLTIFANGVEQGAGLQPAVLREPGPDNRPDFPSNRINIADPNDLWIRQGAGPFATLKQSEAAPGYDARNRLNAFDYNAYFGICLSGVECTSVTDPLDFESPGPLRVGRGPTHAGDTTPTMLHARGGFENFQFVISEAVTLLAGPGEDEEFDGEQTDVRDVSLVTMHTNASDRTRVLVPYGDALFASDVREVTDRATGLTTTLPGNPISGVTVAGPGALEIAVGVRGAANTPTGVGGRLGLSAVEQEGSARGIETIGNVTNPALPGGGASLTVVTAGNIELNSRGSIDTLQGGDIRITSLGGSLIGGQPAPTFVGKRGIFTLNVLPGTQVAAESGGGSIFIDVAGDFDIGRSATAALSGGDIELRSREGSVRAGVGETFEILGIVSSPTTNQPEVSYRGAGVAAPGGAVRIVAEEDVDIGAGIAGRDIGIVAGRNINAGTGSISSSGNVAIDAGGTFSGDVSAGGTVSVGAGTTVGNASISATGLVVGVAGAGSNAGPGKVGAESAVSSGAGSAAQSVAQRGIADNARRSGVSIDVTSRPASGSDDDEEDDDGKDEG